MKQIEQIYQYVMEKNQSQLQVESSIEIGSHALEIAIDLGLNRANVSKELNKLWREGRLFKIDGRPTYFVAYEALTTLYPELFFSSYYAGQADFQQTLQASEQEAIPQKSQLSLSENQKQLYVALSYPIPGFPPLVQFEKGINNFQYVHDVFNVLKENELLNKRFSFKYIDCSNPTSLDFTNFFENALDFQSSKASMFTFYFINHCHLLDSTQLVKLNRFFTNLRWLTTPHENKYVLGLPTSADPSIISVFSTVITTPAFHELSMLDRLNYIIETFKVNAKKLQMNIRIQRELFKAFCFNEVEADYQVIENDITTALIKSYFRAQKEGRKSCVLLWSDFSFPLIHESLPKHTSLNIIDSYFDDSIQFDFSGTSKIDYIYNQPIVNELNTMILKTDFGSKTAIQEMISRYSSRIKAALKHELQALTIHSGYSKFNTNKIHGKESEIGLDFLVTQLNTLQLNNFNPDYAEYIQETYQKSFTLQQSAKTGLLLIIDSRHNVDTYQRLLEPHDIQSTILSLKVPITINALSDVLNRFDNNADIVIVTDITIYQNAQSLLQGVTKRNVLSYYPLSLPLVEDLINKIEKNIPLEELRKETRGYSISAPTSNTLVENEENEFLTSLRDKFLKQQLTFLDASKTLRVLYPVLTNILSTLKLSHTKQFVVKFIVHTSFVIERCIKKEYLEYPDLNNYLKENSEMLSYIEKEFVKVEEIFGIKIPLSELAYISDIFLQN